MLQTAYQRGTKDSDVLETIDLSAETKDRLLAVAGAGTELHRRRRLYLEIVANGMAQHDPDDDALRASRTGDRAGRGEAARSADREGQTGLAAEQLPSGSRSGLSS